MRILSACIVTLALVAPQAALARDRDRDGLPDRWERQNHLSTSKKSSNGDVDRDGVDNHNELREGTRPRNPDSDGDGLADGVEDRDQDGLSNAGEDLTGNDPRVRDSDEDGVPDGEEVAGVVSSIDGNVVTVELARGGSFQALVTGESELECETEGSLEAGYVAPGRRAKHRRRGRHGRHRGHARRASASQLEEDPLEEGEELDELAPDEDELEDEGVDEEEDPDFGSCPAHVLVPGARVHDAELFFSEAGLEFDLLSLVR